MKMACIALAMLAVSTPALADGREELVRSYVDRIVVNSLDEPDRHDPYFTDAAARSIRLMFFLEKVGSEPYRIDDVLRFVEEGKWFSLQAWLERRPP